MLRGLCPNTAMLEPVRYPQQPLSVRGKAMTMNFYLH